MFDLDQKLSEWRTRLLESNVYSASDIEELEAHVLDAMDDLKTKGLTQEEAFWVAVHRIGDVESLNREFSKVNRALIWRRRAVWLLAGYFIISAIDLAVRVVPHLVYAFGLVIGAERPVLGIASVVLAVCLMAAVLILLFSKKIWNLSVVNRITVIARNHYIIFPMSIPVFIVVSRMLLAFTGEKIAETLGGHALLQMVFVENCLSLVWLLLVIASLSILVRLINRSKSFAAKPRP